MEWMRENIYVELLRNKPRVKEEEEDKKTVVCLELVKPGRIFVSVFFAFMKRNKKNMKEA